eukprot:scaffold90892_cov19-Tisochrysis_lutea.AAC.2
MACAIHAATSPAQGNSMQGIGKEYKLFQLGLREGKPEEKPGETLGRENEIYLWRKDKWNWPTLAKTESCPFPALQEAKTPPGGTAWLEKG